MATSSLMVRRFPRPIRLHFKLLPQHPSRHSHVARYDHVRIRTTKQPMKTAIVYVLLLCGVCVPLVHSEEAWKSDFKDSLLGGWEPYGSACKATIVKDAKRDQNVLIAEFDDSSPTPSANKGARIKIGGGLTWEKFNYLSFCYKVNPAVSSIGCLLHDANGNWWQSSRGDPADANAMGAVKANGWESIAFKKASFVFKWNDNATIKAASSF